MEIIEIIEINKLAKKLSRKYPIRFVEAYSRIVETLLKSSDSLKLLEQEIEDKIAKDISDGLL